MDLIWSFLTADWIALFDIAVTSIIGIWIARTVQNSFATRRALKEHYINEIKSVSAEYNTFLNLLYGNTGNSKNIQQWFKIMNIKLETIEQSIHFELIVDPNVLQNHIILKQFVTGSHEFNTFYNSA